MDRGSKTARKEPGRWNLHLPRGCGTGSNSGYCTKQPRTVILCSGTFVVYTFGPIPAIPKTIYLRAKQDLTCLPFFPKLWTLKEARLQLKMQWRAVLGRQRVQAENCWVSYFLSCFSAICTTWRVVFKLKLSLSARIYVHQGYPPTACR